MGDDRQQVQAEVQEAPPKSEKGKEPAPAAPASQSAGDDSGCLLKEDGPAPCPPPDPKNDDPDIAKDLVDLNIDIASSDALKPIKAEQLAFQQGADTVRKDIFDAYEKALNDGLQKDYDEADERFQAIAAELNRAIDGKPPPLEAWIANADPIAKLYDGQRQVAHRLLARSGPRECAFRRAEDAARQWKQAYEDWKSPGAKMKAIVDSYKDKLPKLACDVHAGDPSTRYAIYQFWFEIAPKHLGLRPDPVRKSNAPGVDRLCKALAAYPARRRALASASERGEGGLFRIKPDELDAHRKKILEAWEAAVTAQVRAEVEFKLRPDDAATLKARLAKQVADEASDIKKLLQPPA